MAVGELSSASKALLPAIAALGGMLIPAESTPPSIGRADDPRLGVPMATDIAFAVAALSVFGARVRRASRSSCSPSPSPTTSEPSR